jgi:hypothetical protein
MKRALIAAGTVAIVYALVLFLTGAAAANVTLDPGMNSAQCPESHRIRGRWIDANRDGFYDAAQLECVPLAAPTSTSAPPTVTNTPTATSEPPTVTPVPPSSTCRMTGTPQGAIPPARDAWCALPFAPAVTTHQNGNSWVDDWQHGQGTFRVLGNGADGYVSGGLGNCEHIAFRLNDHWMFDHYADSPYTAVCGSWLRPNRSFTRDGKVVIEAEGAGPIATTDDSWLELVITTAPDQVRLRNNGTYVYEMFPGFWTVGMRIATRDRRPIIALYNDGQSFAGSTDRQWEANQNGGEVRFEEGGGPYSSPQHDAAWKQCNSAQDPDTLCRNTYRWEIYQDSPTTYVTDVYVNGLLYYRAGIIGGLQLDNIFDEPFYVYFGQFGRNGSGTVIRFHWDHIAVHP